MPVYPRQSLKAMHLRIYRHYPATAVCGQFKQIEPACGYVAMLKRDAEQWRGSLTADKGAVTCAACLKVALPPKPMY